MNKKTLALSLLLILTFICATSISTIRAQTIGTGQWITQYTIKDASTGLNIQTTDFATGTTSGSGQIFEGEELEITVTINVGISNPSSQLTLTTNMQHSALQSNMFWQQGSTSYDLGTFNPNSPSISFPESQGTLVISCYGLTPTGIVEQQAPNGVTLNIPTPLVLVQLTDPSGSTLDEINPNIINGNIANYLNLLGQRESSLKSFQSSGVDPGFISIYTNVINASETLNTQGFTDGAISMLNGLNVSAPPSASSQALFIPVAVVLAIVAAVFAFLFIRIRGRISYMQLVVEDEIKDLEGLTMRASKIDRTMSSNLESVKEKLKRLVGM
ncbi:MAG: hypothetical protein ABSD92_01745 [Candidatus Bathyarchaeia archaeon]